MDTEAIKEALIERGSRVDCPCCKALGWRRMPDESSGIVPVGWGLHVIPLVCARCGFVRMHSVEVLFPEYSAEVSG